MTKREITQNWLTTGFQQPTNRLSEIFYFDKRDNEFFSILVTDYFLFDSELNLSKDTTSTYSSTTLLTLTDRMQRIEKKDTSIIDIPRLGDNRNVDINKEVEMFLSTHHIDIDTVTIWETEDGTISIDLNNS